MSIELLPMKSRVRRIGFLSGLFLILFASFAQGQACLEGDCQNGFGELDAGDSFYIGSFRNGKWEGPGVHYNKVTGSITMSYYHLEQPTISIVEFYSGDLELGYRKKNDSDGKMYLYNGFNFTSKGLYKFVDGVRSDLNFDFQGSKCLIGDCNEGYGAEYLVAVDVRKDTAAFLYVGNFSKGTWSGEGAYYEFNTGDFFVGKFLSNAEWNGAMINSEDGLASFMVSGKEVKTLGYEIPEAPPGQAKRPDAEKKGAFWRGLGDFAGESMTATTRSGSRAEITIMNNAAGPMEKVVLATQENPARSANLLETALPIGQSAKLTIPSSHRRSCTVSVLVQYKDGTSSYWNELDICKFNRFELLPGGKFQGMLE
jgi:hypothetical protein